MNRGCSIAQSLHRASNEVNYQPHQHDVQFYNMPSF